MATFVLIHGACHGGWCWERLVPLLEARGHRVLAPDLPGMGEDKTALDTVTAGLWNTFLVDLINTEEEPVVLVGHSRGSMQVTAAAEAIPDRVQWLVYLAAFTPKDGQTNVELVRAHCSQELINAGAQMQGHEGSGFPPEAAKWLFYNTTDAVWATRAVSKQCAEPAAVAMTPTHVTLERYGKVRKGYIECLEDRAILPIAAQRQMQTHTNFETIVSLATDHSPFYCAPEKLAEVLESLAAYESRIFPY